MMADSRQRPAMGQEAGFRQLHFLVGSSVCTDGVISEEDAESAGMVTALSGSITTGGPPVASLASGFIVVARGFSCGHARGFSCGRVSVAQQLSVVL